MEENEKEKERILEENHLIDINYCDTLTTPICEYQKDITILTIGNVSTKLFTVCEKTLVVRYFNCHSLIKGRIKANIQLKRRMNNVKK